MEKIKFGVVVATYNGETYIREQLESVLKQTYPVSEIVISDDGSSDRTIEIVNDIISKNNFVNIKFVKHNSTKQISDNFCYAYTFLDNVDYFFFCDQDDIWKNDKVDIFYKTIGEKEEPDVIFSDAFVTDEGLVPQKKSLIQQLGSKLYNDLIKTNEVYEFNYDLKNLKRILKWNIMTGMNTCVKKSFFNKIVPVPFGILHDRWLMQKGFLEGRIYYIPEKTAFYRQHISNTVGIGKKKTTSEKLHSVNVYLNKIMNIYNSSIELNAKGNIKNTKMKTYLLKYIDFFFKRTKALEKKNFMKLILIALRGGYIKYTYNLRQLVNDLAFCILFRHKVL